MSGIERDTEEDVGRPAVRGGVAGVAATAVMSLAMLAAQRSGMLGRLPPHELMTKAMARTGTADDVGPQERQRLGWVVHFAFGAAAGALYAVLRRLLRTPGPPVAHGIGWGLLVWLISYGGWIPALRLLPAPTKDNPDRPVAMVAAHVVFGAVLGWVNARLRNRPA